LPSSPITGIDRSIQLAETNEAATSDKCTRKIRRTQQVWILVFYQQIIQKPSPQTIWDASSPSIAAEQYNNYTNGLAPGMNHQSGQ
jgi:hypothetical protein